VGDFGSACRVPNGVDKVCSKSLGTVNFLALECLEPEGDGSMQSRERDVFAFARLMWQALTGQRPFFGCSAIQVVLLVSQGYNLELHPAVPEAFRKLYDDCAAVAPSRRPSFREILISLRNLGRAFSRASAARFSMLRTAGIGQLVLKVFCGTQPRPSKRWP
ncbi:unnamed protein product, partial [Symbiodinium necroappetens]